MNILQGGDNSKTAAICIQFTTCIERIVKRCTVNNSYLKATARNP